MNTIKNPIIPGFYPDPSICRVGEDYYICCSSFELCPGLPVFHSRDLAHWEQICYAMTPENKFHVEPNMYSGGVMAPTIRYYKGTFYIINCNFSDEGNFMITAKDPAGPWSDPIYLTDIPGIDASIFFDEATDKVYVMGTGDNIPTLDGKMRQGIWACEYDIENYKCLSEPVALWGGAMDNAPWPESPHMYHIGDYYYLMIAEGGTNHYHAVTIARSKNPLGPYENYEANPVMTHRHLGFFPEIANVGHADFVDTPDGDWYAVMLASRTIDGVHKVFGRETYICPVKWERGWPVFSPGTGKMEWEYPANEKLPWEPLAATPDTDNFDDEKLGMDWSFWGTPYVELYKLEDSKLKLKCLSRSIDEELVAFGAPKSYTNCVSYLAKRQREKEYYLETKMTFDAKGKETAGVAMIQQNNYQFRIEKSEGKIQAVFSWSEFEGLPFLPGFKSETKKEVLAEVPYTDSEVTFAIESQGRYCDVYYIDASGEKKELCKQFDIGRVNPEHVGGMVGTLLGVFASANGGDSDNWAAFDYFTFRQ